MKQILLILLGIVIVAACVPDVIERSLAMGPRVEMAVTEDASLAPAAIEAQVLEWVNAERLRAGLSALQPARELIEVARGRSRDMAERGYFSHVDPLGCELVAFKMLAERCLHGGGENLYLLQGRPADAPKSAVSWWMQSRTHRANLLRADYAYTGVGVAVCDSRIYVTQIFLERQ